MEKLLSLSLIQMITETAGQTSTPEEILKKISWYGQSSIRIGAEGKVIWIDPVGIKTKEKADIVLITHSHGDHYSPPDIERVSSLNTKIIASFKADKAFNLNQTKTADIGGIKIEGVPAYNVVKTHNHPKTNNWMGYIITVNGVRIYHAGDTERIPEMKTFNCDIALVPLGQTYTMSSVKEAVDAVLDTKAKIAIPIHYGMYEGSNSDADLFVSLLKQKGVNAVRLPRL